MKHRRIRQKSTGQFLAFCVGTAGETFSTPADVHIRNAADGWGISVADLESVEVPGTMPDIAGGIPPLPEPLTPADVLRARVRAMLTSGTDSDSVTRGELRDVLRLLRV